MIKIFLVLILLISTTFAFEDVYFLPKDSKKVQKDMEKHISNAKESIDIAMYNLSYRKLVDLLNNASKRGVKVKIYYYKKKADLDERIETVKVLDKLHTKLAIIDKKIVIFGSANWTDETFKDNYEVLYISDRDELVKQFNDFYKTIKRDR
ncbi:MAG: phospholipase D-like domain-containing protein [Arcobacteraceae bacterium]|jgi:phosphatidylserine/phosphatidylglycerophosphate/cardiolipin synthase-like enzyme|nr:phospholipase D-like domain-containing protein [Arcobacteraceae bacterium]